jgi:integrase/recombinase XerD
MMTTMLAVRDESALPGPAYFPSQTDTDDGLIRLWLHGRPETTVRAYQADVDRFRAYVAKPLRMVTVGDVQDFSDSLAHLADASRARSLSAVKSFLSFGCRIGYLPFNVGAPVRLPRLKDTIAERILAEEQVLKMLALEAKPRNAALLRLLYGAGLRVSELVALRWRDVVERDDAAQITVYGKGSKTRFVLLTRATWDALKAIRDDAGPDDALFRSSRGEGALDARQVRRIVAAAARRAGVEANVSPHWLRHAHASHALDRGAAIHLVQATLGHSSVATTGKYLHARPSESSSKYLAV